MTDEQLKTFALNYTEEHFSKIRFDWNGKHGEEFEDPNYDFRMKLCEAIKDDLKPYPDPLIIDLYSQLAESSPATFGIYMSFHLFANELLLRGGSRYFPVYQEGAQKSMDAGMMSSRLDLLEEVLDEILTYIHSEAEKGIDMTFMKNRFEWLKEKSTNS